MQQTRSGVDLHALAQCTVRGRHVAIIFGLVYLLGFAAAYWLSLRVDPLYRTAWRTCLWGLSMFAFFLVITVSVPELRRLFLEATHSGRAATTSDLLIAIGAMAAWGLGASRMIFNYPIALYDPDFAYRWLELGNKLEPGPIYMLLGTASSVVFAPVTEEIVFRGYLLNLWLARHRIWFAILASSMFFGLWHFQYAPFATGMGFIFALVYLKYRSLVLCIVLHGLYNLLVNRTVFGALLWDKDKASIASLSSWSIELTFAIAFIPLAWLFWQRFRPQSASNS